jgi:threonine synthase
MDYRDVAFETIKPWVRPCIPEAALEEMVHAAYPFGAPLAEVGDRQVLELFHGPTAAFKDFGARFMARAFSYLRRGEDRPLRILVATSGDTGGAVADGFFGVEGISVTVLYPKGRVSPLQERQIAGLGGNISALAVEGSFDDCQRLVKAALGDGELKKRLNLSSANSINVSRLIPQAAYYAAAAGRALAGLSDPGGEASPWSAGRQCPGGACRVRKGEALTLVVPSGNFGNLTAGIYAWKMGAPIRRFAAATNINRTIPDYLESGDYRVRPSRATISNAMDVGAPSNFERMAAHLSWTEMKEAVLGASVTDDETRKTISAVFRSAGYFLDPHSGVGWAAADKLLAGGLISGPLGILSTAHPAKFAETVEPLCGPVPVPPSLAAAMERSPQSRSIPAEFSALAESL